MPLFGACISSGFVNLNVMTQAVSERRQALANSLYRGVGAGVAIIAPGAALATAAALGSYAGALDAGALVLGAAGVATLFYPRAERAQPRPTIAAILSGYGRALRERRLMSFVLLEQTWVATHAAVGAFAAIRFTRDLHLDRAAFGTVCTAAAVTSLFGTLASAPLAERMGPQRFMAVVWATTSACALAMGLTDAVAPSACAFVLYSALYASCPAPASMWASRAAGEASPMAAFTVYKIVTAGGTAATMAGLAALEPRLGMRAIFLGGGLLGVPFALAVLRLRRP
jgi:predicted MFS family arabinose efflux permease